MESKKINQLATELTPSLSDLTIIGDPSTGISKKITLSQMASLFTGTVEEYPNLASFPLVGVADTIYIALDTNIIYRWNTGTNAYVELSPNIVTSLVFNDANGFDGTISLVGSTATLTITTALTTGSVGFIGASGALLQDNANFFWDDTNNRLGIGTNAPTTAIDAFGSGIIGRLNGTSTNNAFLGFASAGSNKWSIGNVQSDHRFRIYNEATTSELVSILQTGEFGIGIANPTTKFHIDGGASALIANLDANVSVAKSISFRSDNSNRINLEVSGTESGSNAGADLFIRTYTDAGALIETPLSIVRSTGVTTIKSLTLTNALSVANGGTGITSLTAGRIPFGNGTSAFGSSSNLYWESANNRLWIDRNDTGNISMILKNAYLNQGSLLQFQKNITTTGAINAYIGYGGDSSNNFIINHNGADRLTIASNGASTFQNILSIGSVGEDYVYITGGSGLGSLIQLRTATAGVINTRLSGNLDNYVNASTGNFAVGTSTPDTYCKLTVNGAISVKGSISGGAASTGYFDYAGATTRLFSVGNSGSTKGQFQFIGKGADNSDLAMLYITSNGDFNVYNNTFLGNTGGGSTSPNTHTFYSSGYFQSAYMMQVIHKSTGPAYTYMHDWYFSGASGSWSSGTGQQFLRCRDDQNRLIIYESGNVQNYNNSYGSLSDIKIKENIVDATPKLDKLMQVRIVNYNKIGDTTKQIGVIAQELEKIFPSMIEEFEDTKDIEVKKVDENGNIILDENGNPIMESKLEFLGTKTKSVKYSVFVPMLIKAIQEQQEQIEVLKSHINSL